MVAGGDALAGWVAASLLLSLRIAPVFLFAPPFTLLRVPKTVLALLGIGLSALLVMGQGAEVRLPRLDAGVLAVGAVRELLVGLVPVLVLQLLFGALYLVGRTIDVQAGFGMALLADPSTRAQTPLVGTLFGYVAGVTFFAADGHLALLRFFAASLKLVPLGTAPTLAGLAPITAYAFAVSLIALGIGGAVILSLLLTDLVVAMLSRTVPQMNALLLGIQVKALLIFAVLPVAFGTSAALFAQLVATALAAMPRIL